MQFLYKTAVSRYNGLQNVGIYVGKVVDMCTSFVGVVLLLQYGVNHIGMEVGEKTASD